jgi:hypothetical protein
MWKCILDDTASAGIISALWDADTSAPDTCFNILI